MAIRQMEGAIIITVAGRSSGWLRVDSDDFAAAPVEHVFARHPDVAAVAVYGTPDPDDDVRWRAPPPIAT